MKRWYLMVKTMNNNIIIHWNQGEWWQTMLLPVTENNCFSKVLTVIWSNNTGPHHLQKKTIQSCFNWHLKTQAYAAHFVLFGSHIMNSLRSELCSIIIIIIIIIIILRQPTNQIAWNTYITEWAYNNKYPQQRFGTKAKMRTHNTSPL